MSAKEPFRAPPAVFSPGERVYPSEQGMSDGIFIPEVMGIEGIVLGATPSSVWIRWDDGEEDEYNPMHVSQVIE